MAYGVGEILGALNAKIDSRGNRVFATVSAALTSLEPEMRYEGQSAYITSKRAIYRFVGGTEDMQFVQDRANSFVWKVDN